MVTNEPKQQYQERSRTWSLVGNTIQETVLHPPWSYMRQIHEP